MVRLRNREDPAAPDEMPERLKRFVLAEWVDDVTWRPAPYFGVCDYYKARAEWFMDNFGVVDVEQAYQMARADNGSGHAGYWAEISRRIAEMTPKES